MATSREPNEVVAYWLQEIKHAKKREEKYRKTGKDLLKIYMAEDEQVVPFNILFSNTETLLPALYSAQARPIVQRRGNEDDPLSKLAAEAGRRLLTYILDTNREGYETPHEAFESLVLDALTPGRGMLTVKYDADFRPVAEAQPPLEDDEAPAGSAPPIEEAYNETICLESLVWDRVYIGYAKKWHRVPWIAYEFFLTKEEVIALLGGDAAAKTMATKLKYAGESTGYDEEKVDDRETKGQRKTACVYQIWDKAGGKKVKYLAPTYTDKFLKEDEDPLGLTGFFNTPRPLSFIKKSDSLTPTAPYQLYKVQAEELNELTRRINRVTKACKARALYDAEFGEDLERLMSKEDAIMVPIRTAGSLASDRGIEQAVWFYPIETIVATLQQLYQARESVKQVIYEITGISDILRGATQASETATAQKIKNSWGTLRLKRGQAEVARYIRDVLRMVLELAATKFSEETWSAMTGLPFLLESQAQQLQRQAQAMQAVNQPVPQELQAQLNAPTWSQVLTLLRDDTLRTYKIDLETNSTVEPEAAEDQEAIMKMLGAMGQAMNGIAPLVANGSMPFEVAKNVMLVVARRFRYGDQFEDAINAMQPPRPPDQGAKEAESAQKELELQKKQQISEIQFASQKGRMDVEKQKMQAEQAIMRKEMELRDRELALEAKERQVLIQQEQERQVFDMQRKQVEQEIGMRSKVADLENRRYKTENVVNQKADTALGQGLKAMQGLVQQLAEMVAAQATQNQLMIQELTTALSRPRVKKAIRGKDGRLEAVEESVA